MIEDAFIMSSFAQAYQGSESSPSKDDSGNDAEQPPSKHKNTRLHPESRLLRQRIARHSIHYTKSMYSAMILALATIMMPPLEVEAKNLRG